MKKTLLPFIIIFIISKDLSAQKIIPIEFNGKKYEVLDMTSKGKISWGGYNEEVAGDAAKSESDGAANTKALKASHMLLSSAVRLSLVTKKIGIYHPKMNQTPSMLLKKNLMWTKEAASGHQQKLMPTRGLLNTGTPGHFIIT
jgi:hypothetical protein